MKISKYRYDKLEQEIKALEEERKILEERKNNARQEGDLSENTEYQESSQQFNEVSNKLVALKADLESAEIASEDNSARISIGCYIKVELVSGAEPQTRVFRLDSSGSTVDDDPMERVLGVDSLLGRAINNAVSGSFNIQAPAGNLTYKVTKLTIDEARKATESLVLNG
jgi:transcription elongation factor GreA